MKFPRNARIFRGRLDVAPFATVFFLTAMFLLMTSMVYTPGVRLELPTADDLPGTDRPTVAVALDGNGRLYFNNAQVSEKELLVRLRSTADRAGTPLTLVVHADKSATYEMLVRVTLLAREAGISEALLATLPRPLARNVRR
jgi:biopolymer transport protein ExbD